MTDELRQLLIEAEKKLTQRGVGPDSYSWHGELMVCDFCLSTWNNGKKRGEPATPEKHKKRCPLRRIREAIASEWK